MMQKFFCRISKNHTTYVKVGGVDKKVVFDNSVGNAAGFGEFVTDDKQLIDALMEDRRCGGDWFADVMEVKSEDYVSDQKVELNEYVCRTVNEAIDWLIGLGCQKSKVNTSEKAVVAARELGYDLRFEKGE